MGTETPPPKKIAPFSGESWLSPNTWFLAPRRVHSPKGISSGSSFLAQLMVVTGWLGSRVVSVLDSGAEVQIAVATLSVNSLRQTAHTHCASVHQAAKLVAALLRVAGVTAGLAESNGSLPPGL